MNQTSLIIPQTEDQERCRVNIPIGSRVAMRGKVFKIHLIRGTYHYSFKGVSFYRSKDLDIHIINILANTVAVRYVPPSQDQKYICRVIGSRIDRYKRQNRL